jgi:hypothetical protein
MNTTQTPVSRSRVRRLAFTVPLVLVNAGALVGQSMWAYGKLVDSLLEHHHKVAVVLAVLFALALESIGVYLALEAHAAMMMQQASGGLRLASYAIASVIAGLNYSHFHTESMDWAVALALLSLVSPWLWSVKSKADHRASLMARGEVDPRGVKLSTARKLAAPIRSVKVWKWAAWAGETDPLRAVEGWESATQSTPQSGQTPQLTATIEVAQSAPVQAPALPQSVHVPAIESTPEPTPAQSVDSTDESVTETVTETVTRTRTQTRSRTETRIQTLTDRVESVRQSEVYAAAVESGTELTYDQIGSIIERTGRDVIKPVYLVLYRGQSVESVILGRDA